ncbi:MAG TPA: hypothetical protein VFW84_02580 [Aquabacterium sp.]|uniref:hypothetical protein n=1 Tax=Aquabacterium sp. TaxID=1872578 RepID=UPI002E3629CF|nr:hypothetical protein [Aquabacterium sp.]HEX5371598.1 hypothetical protein [Aquabacterium sp.]
MESVVHTLTATTTQFGHWMATWAEMSNLPSSPLLYALLLCGLGLMEARARTRH